ncbi:MAG: carbohydrate ABC transporter permease [Fibrobacteria bacterium]
MRPKHRNLAGRLLTAATWILILLHVAPIAWMVYCGLKDNQEILAGKVLPGRRQNDVIFLKEMSDGFLAGTADGGITLFSKSGLRKERHLELGTFATSFLLDTGNAGSPAAEPVLWALSSNRGLQRVDAKSLSLQRTYGIEAIAGAYGSAWKTLWVNEVAGSSLSQSGGRLFLSFQFKDYPGVTEFDKATGSFSPLPGYSAKASGAVRLLTHLPGTAGTDSLAMLTGQGIFLRSLGTGNAGRDLRAGRIPSVPERLCALDARRLLLSMDSRACIYDLGSDSVVRWLDRPAGSGIITSFARSAGRIWLGDSRGVTALLDITGEAAAKASTADGLIAAGAAATVNDSIAATGAMAAKQDAAASADRIFLPEFPAPDQGNRDVTSLRVTSILPLAEGGALLGGPNGTLSLLNMEGKSVASALAPSPSLYIHWRNYVDLWRNIDFGLYLKNSFIVCLGVMVVAMVLASMGGYALARYEFPGKNLFGYSVLATQMVPGIMLLLPLYLMFINFSRATGLIVKGTYGGLILTYAAYFVPFSIWILRGFFATLPKELEEAALVDGCGPIQAFFRIIIPSALPGIIATGVYVFLSAWDELMFAWVLTDERTYTIPVGIRLFVGNFQNRYDLMMAAATVSTIPVMVLFFVMQKHIVSGLTAGAVKE